MDDDFEDLFDGGETLLASSQESLTNATAIVGLCESDHEMLEGEPQHPVLPRFDWEPATRPGFNYELASAMDQGEGQFLGMQYESSPTEWTLLPSAPKPAALRPVSSSPVRVSNLVGTGPGEATSSTPDIRALTKPATSVLDRIEAVFEQIADEMLSRKAEIGLSLHIRPRQVPQTGTSNTPAPAERKIKRVCFPGKTAEEAWRFGE